MLDIVVIGGGPAGVSAALRARELGATVGLVERGRLGGTCTNDGCVPTRVLAKAARLIREGEQFAEYGLVGERPAVDFGRLIERTQQIIDKVHEKKQLRDHLHRVGVTMFEAEARFVDPHMIELSDGRQVEAKTFLICTGGHARRLPFPGAELGMTHSDVWSLQRLPASVAIIGAAATGCQLASVFSAFGAAVTLLELAPRILPTEDEQVSEAIHAALRGHQIDVLAGIGGVERIERHDDGLRLHYLAQEEPRALDVEAVILAVGWPGNVEALNLEAANVRSERTYVQVDDTLRTSADNVYAAGDITGRMMLVQSASYEARVAAENAVRDAGITFAHQIVPHGGFTDPEYGSVGMTERQAREKEACAVAVVPYGDLDRAVIDGRTDGFCKLIVSRESREVLGAHVVGEQAVEVVQIVAAAMAAGTPVEELAQLELAYPTFTAIVGLAARQLARELGHVPVAPEWRSDLDERSAEWERSER